MGADCISFKQPNRVYAREELILARKKKQIRIAGLKQLGEIALKENPGSHAVLTGKDILVAGAKIATGNEPEVKIGDTSIPL